MSGIFSLKGKRNLVHVTESDLLSFSSQLLEKFAMQKPQGEAGWCIRDSAVRFKPAPRIAVIIWVNVDFH